MVSNALISSIYEFLFHLTKNIASATLIVRLGNQAGKRSREKGGGMKGYVAWLDGHSVAVGTLSGVEAKARQIFHSENYQRFCGPTTTLKITRGPRQLFVKSIVLTKGGCR